MNAAVAVKIRNSYSGLKLPGKDKQMTNVKKVMIASTILSHPSFVVTIQTKSQQLQVHVRVVVVVVVVVVPVSAMLHDTSWVRQGGKTAGHAQCEPGQLPAILFSKWRTTNQNQTRHCDGCNAAALALTILQLR